MTWQSVTWGRRIASGLLCAAAWWLPAAASTEDPAGTGLRASPRADLGAPTALGWSLASATDPGVQGSSQREGEAAPAEGYRWRGPMPTEPDWRGARHDAYYFLGYQFVAIGVLYVLPVSVSGWTDEQKENYNFDQWKYNVTHPTWDHDKWYINYVLHPYWGATYYIRGRERGLDRVQSLWFSALMSALYEYGGEAIAEQVSIQDLFVTPLAGALLGEYVFSPWRERIRAKSGQLDWSDKAVLVLTDPLGVINAEIDRWFGVKSSVQIQPLIARVPAAARDPQSATLNSSPRRPSSGWSLQVRAEW